MDGRATDNQATQTQFVTHSPLRVRKIRVSDGTGPGPVGQGAERMSLWAGQSDRERRTQEAQGRNRMLTFTVRRIKRGAVVVLALGTVSFRTVSAATEKGVTNRAQADGSKTDRGVMLHRSGCAVIKRV